MAPNKKKLKVAIMGAKGYPYVYGGYDTLIRELGERFILGNFFKSFMGDRGQTVFNIGIGYPF